MKRPYMSFLPLSLIRIAVGVVGCWHEGTLALFRCPRRYFIIVFIFFYNKTFHVTNPTTIRGFSPNTDSTKHLGPKTCIVCNILDGQQLF